MQTPAQLNALINEVIEDHPYAPTPATIEEFTSLTPEKIASWSTEEDEVRKYMLTLFILGTRAAGTELLDYGSSPFHYGDDDVDYFNTTVEFCSIINHLYYEGSPADLSFFLFNTDEDAENIILSLCQIDSAGGCIYSEPLNIILQPFLDRIEKTLYPND